MRLKSSKTALKFALFNRKIENSFKKNLKINLKIANFLKFAHLKKLKNVWLKIYLQILALIFEKNLP